MINAMRGCYRAYVLGDPVIAQINGTELPIMECFFLPSTEVTQREKLGGRTCVIFFSYVAPFLRGSDLEGTMPVRGVSDLQQCLLRDSISGELTASCSTPHLHQTSWAQAVPGFIFEVDLESFL